MLLLLLALPDALLNRSYSPEPAWERVSTRCAMPIPTTRVVAGELPPGLSLSPRGDFNGAPTVPGTYSFTVELSDGCSRRLEQRQLRVTPAPILLAEADVTEFHCPQGSPPFPAGIVRVSGSTPGRAYSVDVFSDDGKWLEAAMTAGALPAEGLALEADTLQLRINPAKLAPGAYTARLRLSTWQGANAPELQFRLRVDSPQSIIARVAPPPAPMPIEFRIVEAPSPQIIVAPRQPHVDPPYFPKYVPKPKVQPRPAARGGASHGVGRSRILPFPKVVIKELPQAKKPKGKKPEEKKPEEKKPAETKSAEKKTPEAKVAKGPEKPKAPEKKEPAPERTKPSAMPPPPAAKAAAKPAH